MGVTNLLVGLRCLDLRRRLLQVLVDLPLSRDLAVFTGAGGGGVVWGGTARRAALAQLASRFTLRPPAQD